MRDPYLLPSPWIVSFSGGRTSGYMLRRILDAHGGVVPPGCAVAFANTGREHESTLRFVDRISREWNVGITWIERRFKGDPGFTIVDYASASRRGEPFEQLIQGKKFLPNPVMRFCTEELKVKAIALWAKSAGILDATMAIGLRADEPRRVHKVDGDHRNGFDCSCPIARAGHTLADVDLFWKQQHFDLELPNNDRAFGNCDLCFLKGNSMLDRVIRLEPDRADWWIRMESMINATFRKDRLSYAQRLVQVRIQGELFSEDDDDSTIACTCTD